MARKGEDRRTYNISVVGLSGGEREKGSAGVGKSCLCNRFIRPLADEYHTDHISLLSQTDFGGRVVNNDHFLYWGEVAKVEEGIDFTFQVIEQTEFVDDSLFQQFKSGKTEQYSKRCTATKLQSAEKLMYICKDQLALEHEFPQVLMPEGKMNIDGFICTFDVSDVSNRSIDKQVEITSIILNNLMKTKKPVLLALTKMDVAVESYILHAERMLARKELKGNIMLIETSAHENVNVDQCFINLAHLVDKNKNRVKYCPFDEALKCRSEQVSVANAAYMGLLRSHVTGHRTTWLTFHKTMCGYSDFNYFIELCGTHKAKKLFLKHISQLKQKYISGKERMFCDSLTELFERLLPDMDTGGERDWNEFKEYLLALPDYADWFLPRELTETIPWELIELPDDRIPFNFLDSKLAEQLFHSEVKRHDLKKKFWLLLDDHPAILPGKQLAEVSIQLMGRVSYDLLSERDRYEVYERFQTVLKDHAKTEFQELLFENPKLFTDPVFSTQVTQEDLLQINSQLSDDTRYQALNKMADDRKRLIIQHLAFVHCPSRSTCPFRMCCMDNCMESALASRTHRSPSWSRCWSQDDGRRSLNLVILGASGLCDGILADIRDLYPDDEFTLGATTYSLDYRTIDGDVSLPQYSSKLPEFRPDGCICAYSTPQGLEYLRHSLEKTMIGGDSACHTSPDRVFRGLPAVILHVDRSRNELLYSEGQALALRLHCPFLSLDRNLMSSPIDLMGSLHDDVDDLKLTSHRPATSDDVVRQALTSLIEISTAAQTFTELSTQPDLRLMMCFMCGDQFSVSNIIQPVTSHQLCHVSPSNRCQTLRFVTHIADMATTVELAMVSYHGAPYFLEELSQIYHGFVCVYSAKRKASLAAVDEFLGNIPNVPKLVIANTEALTATNAFAYNMRMLVNDGHEIAENFGAQFMVSAISPTQQNEKMMSFLHHCLDNKDESERIYEERRIPYNETSSEDESDPLYDSPKEYNISPRFSDSDGEPLSCSPPVENGIYQEIPALMPRNPGCASWIQNDLYSLETDFSPLIPPPPPPPPNSKRKLPPRPKGQYVNMPEMIRKKAPPRQDSLQNDRQAPLATMDPIEISDYMPVKDALYREENSYARVQDALPPGTLHKVRSKTSTKERKNKGDFLTRFRLFNGGSSSSNSASNTVTSSSTTASNTTGDYSPLIGGGSESDSEFSSLERKQEVIYARTTHRKPTSSRRRQKKLMASPSLRHSMLAALPAPFRDSSAIRQVRSNSPSEGSGEDEYMVRKKSYDGGYGHAGDGHVYEPVVASRETMVSPGPDGRKKSEKQRKKDEKRRQKQIKEEERRRVLENPSAATLRKKSQEMAAREGPYASLVLEPGIPLFVERCVQYIELEGLSTEGIYRVSGNKQQVDFLIERWKEDPGVDISSLNIPVTAVASALKAYIKSLPVSVIPPSLFDEINEAEAEKDMGQRLRSLKVVLKKLPSANLDILKYLIMHIAKISDNAEVNAMNNRNLAIIWWPTLIRAEILSLDKMAIYQEHFQQLVLDLIEHRSFLFAEDAVHV